MLLLSVHGLFGSANVCTYNSDTHRESLGVVVITAVELPLAAVVCAVSLCCIVLLECDEVDRTALMTRIMAGLSSACRCSLSAPYVE